MGFLLPVPRRMETQLLWVNEDAANTFSSLFEKVKGKKVHGNGYLHTAAELNPFSMKNEALCLPVIRQEGGVLCGIASKGEVIFVNKIGGNQ